MITCHEVKEHALSQLSLLFECGEDDRGRLRILTPYLFPDSDYVELYVEETPAGLYLTDLGETVAELRAYKVSLKQSTKRQKIVDEILMAQGVELFRGALRAKVDTVDQMPWALTRLGQAIIQIGDLVHSVRVGTAATFADEIEEYLSEIEIPFERKYRAVGGSGETYQVDFFVPGPRKGNLVMALSANFRSHANSLVSKTVRAWHDIHRVDGRYDYTSLLDDSTDVWKEEWIEQLSALSNVFIWADRVHWLEEMGFELT